jgi:hypothetical protein
LIWAVNCGDPWLFMLLSAAYNVLVHPFLGYALACFQMFTPHHLRERQGAFSMVVITLIASMGAPAIALFTELVSSATK